MEGKPLPQFPIAGFGKAIKSVRQAETLTRRCRGAYAGMAGRRASWLAVLPDKHLIGVATDSLRKKDMSELFNMSRAATHLEWTGERLTTATAGQVEVEHYHRYFLARRCVRGLDVLDIASGEGYGSALLAQTAKSVVGVEIDPMAVSHASKAYVAPNLRFQAGRAQEIPLGDRSVDCVVSFETLEHFYEQEQFLDEIRRVLRPGGFLILSSPNREIYSPPGSQPNPHHVRELSREEVVSLVERRFGNVILLGQRPIVGSVISREVPVENGEVVSFERRGPERWEATEGLSRTLYWIVMASDGALPQIEASCYFEAAGVDDALVEAPRLRVLLQQSQEQNRQLFEQLASVQQWRRSIQVAPAPSAPAAPPPRLKQFRRWLRRKLSLNSLHARKTPERLR